MARFEFRLPDIGEGVAEGEIVKWLVEAGQLVSEDEPLVEVMTDKATVVIGSPSAGRVDVLGAAPGATVQVGGVLAVLDVEAQTAIRLVESPERGAVQEGTTRWAAVENGTGILAADNVANALSAEHGVSKLAKRSPSKRAVDHGVTKLAVGDRGSNGETSATAAHTFAARATKLSSAPSAASSAGAARTVALQGGAAASACGELPENLPGVGLESRAMSPAPVSTSYFHGKPLATPATRKLARDLGIDLRTIRPTGPCGRVSSDDVHAAHARAQRSSPDAEPPPMLERNLSDESLEERVPLRGLRKRIFESMTQSARTAAHCTLVEECDVTSLKRMRDRLKAPASDRGVRLSFLPFIVKAVVGALRRHPDLNASFDEATQEIVTRRYYNIGIAVSTEAGLVVPVIKAADKMSLLEIAARIDMLAEQARAHQIDLDSLKGGTFTITSLGTMGGLLATPVIRLPEVAILGVHKIKQKPVVRAGEIVIGDVMMVSLSFDHRLIDGHVAAGFVYDVVGALEEPERLLLE